MSNNQTSSNTKKTSFKEALLNKRMLICLFNGFTAGLPLYYLLQLIPAWLRTEGIDLKTIGLVSLVTMPYTFKVLWAPFVDSISLPFLGKRRGWMLLTQIGCLVTMLMLSGFSPKESMSTIVIIAVCMAVFSATQDIVLDAYRRELLPDEELGLGSTFYQNAYRVAGFVPGGLGILMADFLPWSTVHIVVGLFMLVGVVHTLLIPELSSKGSSAPAPRKKFLSYLYDVYVLPFTEFFSRSQVGPALLILLFMFLYKLGDTMATALSTPFYIDMGFSLTEIGSLIKLTNFWSMFAGSLLGGLILYKTGINKALWAFGILQWLTIYGFVWLSVVGNNVPVLIFVLVMEYLAAGLGTSAFMAYIASVSSKNFAGTQLALFSALFALARSLAGSVTGFLIEGIKPEDEFFFGIFGAFDGLGWTNFFYLCGFIAIPGLLLMIWVAPWNEKMKSQ